MIEVIDREPLGNKKNNRVWFNIPSNVTTVAQLVSLLRDGCLADVFANNDVSGADVGVATPGTPLNRYLFTSIDEGGGSDNGELSDIVACSGAATITAAWNYVPFPRILIKAPSVTATGVNTAAAITVTTKDVTDKGFYVCLRNASGTFIAGNIQYVAMFDGGIDINT